MAILQAHERHQALVQAMRRSVRLRHGGAAHGYTSASPSPEMRLAAASSAERIMSLWALPEGIIGKQFSFGSTATSHTTGPGIAIMSRMVPSRSSGRVT